MVAGRTWTSLLKYGEDPGMTLDLVADQVRQGVTDRTIQLANDDFWLGTQMILRAFDQCLARPQQDAFTHSVT